MNRNRTIERIVRRETHSSRAAASVLTATVLLAVLLWLALETALRLAGVPALLMAPGPFVKWLAGVPTASIPAWLAAAGIGITVAGVLLVLSGVTGGRRPRTAVRSSRCAIVVDHEVIASSVSRVARLSAGVAPGQVTTTLTGRSAKVMVRPTSGVTVDADAVEAAVRAELAGYGLTRNLTPSLQVDGAGVVGQ